MYGTVARIRTLPGKGAEFEQISKEYEHLAVDGQLATYVFKLDAGPDEYYLVAVFRDQASYHANASSPEQHERYLRMRALLAEDPKWHDGEVAWSM